MVHLQGVVDGGTQDITAKDFGSGKFIELS
jgi:hypothetical protein